MIQMYWRKIIAGFMCAKIGQISETKEDLEKKNKINRELGASAFRRVGVKFGFVEWGLV